MYMTLKGIGKVLLVPVSKTSLICKFLNFTAIFINEKIELYKVCIQFSVWESWVYDIVLTLPLIAFEEHCYVLRFCQVSVKVTFKQIVKNNDYWKFLIFYVLTLVFPLELETGKGSLESSSAHIGSSRIQTETYWNSCCWNL